jgi:GNAT superfamily N-acetyltransferase
MRVFKTVQLTSEDAASGFHSGKEPLDDFFERSAGQNQRKEMNRTWVLRRESTDPPEWPRVLGFYSVAAGHLAHADYPEHLAKKLPRYEIPIVLIARLAVDERVKGKGFGSLLLGDAEDRVLAVAAHLGVVAVVVDAKDGEAARFYRKGGYAELPGQTTWPRRMFVTTKALRQAAED